MARTKGEKSYKLKCCIKHKTVYKPLKQPLRRSGNLPDWDWKTCFSSFPGTPQRSEGLSTLQSSRRRTPALLYTCTMPNPREAWPSAFPSVKILSVGSQIKHLPQYYKKPEPWLVWLSGLSASLWTNGSLIQFPVRARVPGLQAEGGAAGGTWEATTHWCFSPSHSPSLPISL